MSLFFLSSSDFFVYFGEIFWIKFGNCIKSLLESILEIALIGTFGLSCSNPTSMSEALYCIKFIPFWWFCIINLHWYILPYCVSSTTHYNHKWTEEQCWMLVTRCWCSFCFIRSLNPIPSAITMTTKTPGVSKGTLISGSSTKANHHTSSTSCQT